MKNILIFLERYSRCLNFELNRWKYVHEVDIPKQLNDSDCGVYIFTYATAVINTWPVSVESVLLARSSISQKVSSITANVMSFNNIDHLNKDVVIGSTIFQNVTITNDLPQLLHVEQENEPVILKTFYHKLCNLENGKSSLN